MIEHIEAMQRAIDYIESHITDELTVEEIAREAFISKYHFQRLFSRMVGMPVIRYVTKRRLQYALYELAGGDRVIDVAFRYGFESHAGFTRAFKKMFGYPPSLYRSHLPVEIPDKLLVSHFYKNYGGIILEPEIMFKESIAVAGYLLKKNIGNVHTRDIPVFYDDCGPLENVTSKLSHIYKTLKPKVHGEFCLAVNPSGDGKNVSYLLAVRADDPDNVPADMTCIEIPAGTYAVFTTPWAHSYREGVELTRKTWKYILDEWFPNSGYEIDENGYDYEYEDERAHREENNGKTCIDIYIPVKKR